MDACSHVGAPSWAQWAVGLTPFADMARGPGTFLRPVPLQTKSMGLQVPLAALERRTSVSLLQFTFPTVRLDEVKPRKR